MKLKAHSPRPQNQAPIVVLWEALEEIILLWVLQVALAMSFT
jgi:hypothetical protein